MIPLRLGEIAKIVGGTVYGDPAVEITGSAVIDSRQAGSGDLFVAFRGEHVDGHGFASQAREGGAVAVLGARPVMELPTVVVDDVQTGLQVLAKQVLERLRTQLTVIALTGSQGKTSTKDLLAAVLRAQAETVATHGSFNNEIGLPLTVLRASASTRFLVLEMGARGVGHLSELVEIAPPDIALVLNVGSAHLGEFGSRANIALAKGEIVDSLGPQGVAILNADDPLVAAMASRCAGAVVTFGHHHEADLRLGPVDLDDLGRPQFSMTWGEETKEISMKLLGAHQALNAGAVAATALACGSSLQSCASALQSVTALSRWRMELAERADGLAVINDAYNANPESMAAAIETLTAIGGRCGRRTIAVLGEMLELGESSQQSHRKLGAQTKGVDTVIAVGANASGIIEGRVALTRDPEHAIAVESVEAAIQWLRDNTGGSDVVLIKASRSIGLEAVADALLHQGSQT
ncbi:MAG TPA: UDP-N-acetylmuramoyl-tripeptide--D-alanyl-D-alanine ligase [Marmoricola sp.]|nr:UDP-N-acetylmuramoyl-tripeptide--D-alanyl-D-alanine ligase [Nocardioidaceae bacterium]MCB8993638.1 UDP-N-acetylmuramoyl-tripeptide--D-alanyl-D-alanine ligase [Nocardioidaceae bacterium]MCO5324516.1 UDP-N-acetylmuramoyl-tripeptide--D-alanyl-D-alanine ligase [Nocardioidaceae bacterium]HRV68173.1 UDP-N-acetylmuramoyl-tripeptide--D-alanyl-D-alanine ligase [Marmoricola sp.]